ncbi:MAG: translocation/assembly module TamB domain-containing protein [Bacteroidales bacterium]
MLLCILALPLTAFIALQSDHVQTYMARHALNFMAENIDTKFTVGRIAITFFNRVEINNLYIEDLAGDTLLYSEKLTASIARPRFKQKILRFQRATLDHSFINLYIDSANNINIKLLLDKFIKKGNGNKEKWDFEINNIRINDSRFNLVNFDAQKKEYGINFGDLQLTGLNIDIRRFKPKGDTLNFIIRKLGFTEQSGFVLSDFNARTSICNNHMLFDELKFHTPFSSFDGNRVHLRYNHFNEFKITTLYSNVRLNVLAQNSSLNFYDLAFFAPFFRNSFQSVILSGEFDGTIDNISGKNVNLKFGKYSSLECYFDLDGLPDINRTFIYARFKKLQSRISDLKELTLPGNRHLNLPDQFEKLGTFSYSGQFTGFINDFVAYGTLNSDMGLIKTDVLLKPDVGGSLAFNGKVQTENFKLGKLLENENNIGDISFHVNTDGHLESGKSFSANTEGEVQYLELKQYVYRNIKLSGVFRDKNFNGKVFIQDPNIIFDFRGELDFASDTPRYDFVASVLRANLYALNLDRSDPAQELSFDIEANAEGDSLNNFNGNIKLVNALFSKKDKQIQLYDFYASVYNNHHSNSFIIRSDFLDMDVSGRYQLDKIGGSVTRFVHSFLPSLIDSGKLIPEDFKNRFQFKATFKNTKAVFDYFLPDYFVGENSTFQGIFEPDSNYFYLFGLSPLIRVQSNTWNNLNIIAESDHQVLNITTGSESLEIGNRIALENFTIYSDIGSDTLGLTLRWNNWDSASYRGEIKADISFEKFDSISFPAIVLDLKPTRVFTYDTLWNISESDIRIQKRKIEVDNLIISHNNQSFRVFGNISENPSDVLSVEFNNFNLDNLNVLTQSEGFSILGILNGEANISSIFANPVFYSELNVDSLIINNELLGYTQINSKWNNRDKSIEIDAYARRGNLRTFTMQGDYFPGDQGRFDFDIGLNKLRLDLFNPYIKGLANNLKGMVSGEMVLAGNIKKPVISGEMLFQKASFTVNYLKTRYNFTNKIVIDNNNILINDLLVFDQHGNTSKINGTVTNNYLKNFRFNLNINAKNFEFLNTSSSDNSQFYGAAFASGLVIIRGTPKNITMDINAKTEKNTKIFIPLSNPEEITQYDFVNFILPDEEQQSNGAEKKYQVNLTGLQLNFDLEVTPDAEVQLIFDPTVGDIIKGKGSGNLKMQINTLGKFNMYGNYTVEEGEYLFTLLNVINRKFLIEYGGTITWNGNPLDAEINLKAIYRTKASLNNLLVTTEGYTSKTTVDCQILMTGKLMSPNIQYDIYLPHVEEATRELVKNKISNSEQLNKQFSSLLVLNSFMPEFDPAAASSSGTLSPYSNAANANASEFLSNQLSHLLSQISGDVDLALNYRSDRVMKSDEIEVAMSTQLLNDRLTIYGNLGVPTNAAAQASNSLVGDVDVDYKITKNGKLRVKAFNRSNEEQFNYVAPYTQGFGLVYKEEFNTFSELWQRYWNTIVGDVDRKKKKSGMINN